MGKKDEDEIPLLEAAEIVDRRRFRKTPEAPPVATIRYTVKSDETLDVSPNHQFGQNFGILVRIFLRILTIFYEIFG